ncbi:unnamed protein product [Cylindrotheca closterium]|uniref:Uncharacterized protein n=1 Tax=Cylindrotheca closterium TaxID=2856 RepID=A0AAD2CU07_9STRA|nr:unnamed protein product [Cylindrotheca closterium]
MARLNKNRKRSRKGHHEPRLFATFAVVITGFLFASFGGDCSCNTVVSAFQPTLLARRRNLSFSSDVTRLSSPTRRPLKKITSPDLSHTSSRKNDVRSATLNANSQPESDTEDDEAVKESTPMLLSKDDDNGLDDNWNIPSLAMLTLPILSGIFPFLLQTAKSLPPNSTEQWAVIGSLFVGNRVYLYALSGTIVALAGLRGATDSSFLGQRIVDLTEELLYRPSLESKTANLETVDAQSLEPNRMEDVVADKTAEEKPAMIEALRQSGVDTSLDQLTGETQALLLPVLITLSLATSVILLPLWTGGDGDLSDENSLDLFSGFLKEQEELLSKIIPKLSELWNFGLLTLFTRSEVRRLIYEILSNGTLSEKYSNEMTVADVNGKGEDDAGLEPLVIIEWASAISIALAAFLWKAWPAQNFVNMALAILVARAIQLDRLTVVLGALSLLTIYDATSVFLVPAATATDLVTSIDLSNTMDATSSLVASTVATSLATDSSNLLVSSPNAAGSAMGSVAVQKLTSTSFQPGLLTIRIGNDNRLGGSLGLGDAVFPSLLAMLTRRFDLEQVKQDILKDEEKVKGASLFAASLGGYFLGCFACEFAPMISTSGIPALVFIVPSMIVSVFLVATLSGQLEGFLEFAPNMDIQSEE